MADKGGSAGWYMEIPVPVKEFEPTGTVGESQGMVGMLFPSVPGFEKIEPCHIEGDSALPQIALQVCGANGMGLLNGDRRNITGAFHRP